MKTVLPFLAAASLVAAPPVRAAEPPLYVLPSVLADPQGVGAAAEFLSSREAGVYFREKFAAAFPSAVDQITDGARARTFVVSLQTPRVSEYVIPKVNGTVERQFAMTASLYFTNISTGEVLFTYTATAYISKLFGAQTASPSPAERADLYRRLYADVVSDVIAKSRAAFRPFEITATARDRVGPLVVLDKGTSDGVSLDDSFLGPGAELRVIFADAHYAMALQQFGGRPASGSQWSKYSTRTLNTVEKAPAVVRVAENRSGFAGQSLEQMFADALGEKSALAIVPVNSDYSRLVDAVRQKTDISPEATTVRALPRYFVRVTAPKPVTYELPTNLDYKTIRVARARVFAEVVDRAGRVEFSGVGEDAIRDEVTAGMGFDPQARAEVAVRNAIVDLARKMSAALKLDYADLSVQAVRAGELTVADARGVMQPGAELTLLRPSGRLPGVEGPLFAPTWSAQTRSAGSGVGVAEASLQVYQGAPDPRPGDIARLSQISSIATRGARRIAPCGSSPSLGSRPVPGFAPLALNRFAASPLVEADLSGFVREASHTLEQTGQFKAGADVAAIPAIACVEPVERTDVLKEDCDAKGVCTTDVNLRVTYRLRRNGEIIFRDGLETTVHSTAYWRTTPASEREALIDADVSAAAGKLLSAILEKPDFRKALDGLDS